MKSLLAMLGFASVLALGLILSPRGGVFAAEARDQNKATLGEFTVAGPFTHDNLSIFLVHGKDQVIGAYLTFQEALAQKKVVVYETGDVNNLSIENVGDTTVYIQAGDIVKGGQQDRTLGTDLVLKPHSGKVPIAAFCVESGRWEGRGGESAKVFASGDGASDMIAGKEMRLAANANYSQSAQADVWKEARQNQEKLSANTGHDVQSATSPSSFELSLEDKKVVEETQKYARELETATAGQDDAVGYAYAINGKFVGADIYASGTMFRQMWPKMLHSASVEAFADLKKDQKFAPASAADMVTAMQAAQSAKSESKSVNDRTDVITSDGASTVKFETHDKDEKDACLHQSYLAK